MQEFIDKEARKHKFKIKAKVFGKEVEGNFECKYPSVLDTLKIQTLASRLLEGSDSDNLLDSAVLLAFTIAANEVLLTKRPSWYKPEEMDDTDVVMQVNEEVKKFTDNFRKAMYETEDIRPSTREDNTEVMESK